MNRAKRIYLPVNEIREAGEQTITLAQKAGELTAFSRLMKAIAISSISVGIGGGFILKNPVFVFSFLGIGALLYSVGKIVGDKVDMAAWEAKNTFESKVVNRLQNIQFKIDSACDEDQ